MSWFKRILGLRDKPKSLLEGVLELRKNLEVILQWLHAENTAELKQRLPPINDKIKKFNQTYLVIMEKVKQLEPLTIGYQTGMLTTITHSKNPMGLPPKKETVVHTDKNQAFTRMYMCFHSIDGLMKNFKDQSKDIVDFITTSPISKEYSEHADVLLETVTLISKNFVDEESEVDKIAQ